MWIVTFYRWRNWGQAKRWWWLWGLGFDMGPYLSHLKCCALHLPSCFFVRLFVDHPCELPWTQVMLVLLVENQRGTAWVTGLVKWWTWSWNSPHLKCIRGVQDWKDFCEESFYIRDGSQRDWGQGWRILTLRKCVQDFRGLGLPFQTTLLIGKSLKVMRHGNATEV